MNDTISRQPKNMCENTHEVARTANDCISRRAAIDALRKSMDKNAKGEIGSFYNTVILKNIEILESLPPAPVDLITKIQNGIRATDADDVYSCGMRNGMRWCLSLIDGKEPLYENCPSAQPERKNGRWMSVTNDESLDVEYECSVCGYELFYSNPTKFCPNCGADMREGDEK